MLISSFLVYPYTNLGCYSNVYCALQMFDIPHPHFILVRLHSQLCFAKEVSQSGVDTE